MPLNIKGGTNISVQSNNATHTVTITNTMIQKQGTYNMTLANNIIKNSGGNRINFINGSNSTVHLVNDPSRNQINITVSSTGGGGGGSGVSSLNALTGALTIACVSGNTTCTTSGGNTITVNTAYNVVVTNGARQIITKPLNMTQDLTITSTKKLILNANRNDSIFDTGTLIRTSILGNQTTDTRINQFKIYSSSAASAPTLITQNLSPVAPGSTVGQLIEIAPNTAGTGIQYGTMLTSVQSTTPGTETSAYRFFVYHAGTQTEYFRLDGNLNATKVETGAFVVGTGANHTTTSGDNFIYIPLTNGAVTANPATFTGSIAEYYDTSGNKNCFYNGVWKCFAFMPQINFTTPANQTGTASLTGVLLGDGVTMTPSTTGRVEVTVTGYGTQNTGTDGGSVQIEQITGGCQGNGAPIASGTAFGSNEKMTMSATTTKVPFSLTIQSKGLTIGQKYCFEIKQVALTGGTFTVLNAVWSAKEF